MLELNIQPVAILLTPQEVEAIQPGPLFDVQVTRSNGETTDYTFEVYEGLRPPAANCVMINHDAIAAALAHNSIRPVGRAS
jgi:hypothetical protein